MVQTRTPTWRTTSARWPDDQSLQQQQQRGRLQSKRAAAAAAGVGAAVGALAAAFAKRREARAGAAVTTAARTTCIGLDCVFPQRVTAATLASPAAYKASPSSEAVTREALGRATWTLLHTLGAQFPDRPTRRQRRAARQLIAALGDVYPCASCAWHWGDVLAELGPPRTGSGEALRAYLCAAHNVVNRSLGKGVFDCAGGALASRWGYREGEVGYAPLCGEEGADVCALQGRR